MPSLSLLLLPLLLLLLPHCQATTTTQFIVSPSQTQLRAPAGCQLNRTLTADLQVWVCPPGSSPEQFLGAKFAEPDVEVSIQQEGDLPPSWAQDWIYGAHRDGQGQPDPTCGEGVLYYPLDTGVEGVLAWEFGSRVERGVNLAPLDEGYLARGGEGQGSVDPQGHGTHVSSLAAGGNYGVAPGARIVPVRVLDSKGRGTASTVIDGLNWVREDVKRRGVKQQKGKKKRGYRRKRPPPPAPPSPLRLPPVVVGMSLQGPLSQAMNNEVEALIRDLGVAVVVAGGNRGEDACLYSPSSAEGVISVGAFDPQDRMTLWSNKGKCIHILAPGERIPGACPNAFKWDDAVRVCEKSGTSMSQPLVAGVIMCLGGGRDAVEGVMRGARVGEISQVVGGSPNLAVWMDHRGE